MGNSSSCTLPACCTQGSEAPVGASRGDLAFLLTYKYHCSGAGHQYPHMKAHTHTSALKVNGEALSPSEDQRLLRVTAPCGSGPLHLPPLPGGEGGSHVAAAWKDIPTSIFATPINSKLRLSSAATALAHCFQACAQPHPTTCWAK